MKGYVRYTKFLLVWVFLVIIAGAVVRMTQSGMGCPDWPTCFGKWIPPTSINDLPPDYEKYLKKQDIDHTFNVYHTWIESINRYLGALLGIIVLIHVIWSYRKFFKTNRAIFWWSFGLLLLTGFQGWLGKKVVDENLAVAKITTHMIVALIIAAIPVLIMHKIGRRMKVENKGLKILSIIALLLLFVQIAFGTDVREQIDEISKSLSYTQRELWIERLDIWFKVHRSFSWVVGASLALITFMSYQNKRLQQHALINLGLVAALILIGVTMMYANIPAIAQPLHLLVTSILAISLFSFSLKLK
jgi:cytochrome c oxidase assembly protein subunit 15